jgi:hypothetical protein
VALDTYANLQVEVADWLNRADLTSKIPTFISLLEAYVSRKLRVRQMVTRSDANITSEYTALPSDFRALQTLQLISTDPTRPLQFATISELQNQKRLHFTTAKPVYYGIVGNTIQVVPAPDQTYGAEIVYWAALPALSVTNTTNWLLTEHPDLYLYGTLLQAAPYLVNDDRIATWGQIVGSIIEDLNVADEKASKSGNPLRARIKPYGVLSG